jgi:hypothetical protein
LPDIIHLTRAILEEATGESLANHALPKEAAKAPTGKKNPAAMALSKLSGKKGGPARRDKLTPERRKEIAREAARARWKKPS